MLKLLRRQAEWLLGLGLLMILLFCLCLSDHPNVDIFQLPQGHVLKDLFSCFAIAGLVLGLFVGLYDHLTSTRDFIRHRPLSTKRLHAVEHAASLLVLLACFSSSLLIRRVFLSDRGGRWGGYQTVSLDALQRWFDLFCCSTLSWACYAIGIYATQSLGNRFMRLLQAAVLMTAWTFLSYGFMESHWRLSAPVFAILQISFCLYILFLGAWNVEQAEDQDLALSQRSLVANFILVGVAAVFSLGILVTEMQSKATASLHSAWPHVEVCDGAFLLVKKKGRWEEKDKLVNDKHSVEGVDQAALSQSERWSLEDRQSVTNSPYREKGPSSFGVGPVMVQADMFSSWWLDYDRGVLRRFDQEWTSAERTVHQGAWVLKPDDGRPFSWSTEVRVARDDRIQRVSGISLLILDREDGRLWGLLAPKVDLDDPLSRIRAVNAALQEPTLIALTLPDDDVPIDFSVSLQWRDEEATPMGFLIRGKRGQYVVENGVVLKTDYDSLRFHYDTELRDGDHLSQEFFVRDMEGRELFRHHFKPYTEEEKWAATKVIAATFLRAPLSVLASLAAPDLPVLGYKEDRVVFDPLVAGGRRLWLVGAVFFLSTLLALLQEWRLRRLGAARSARMFWFLMVLFGGVGIMILALLIEGRRRHTALPNFKSKPLLLKSA